MRPSAAVLGLQVEEDARLREGNPPEPTTRFLEMLAKRPTVVCSHGDVIGGVLTYLLRNGLETADAPRWGKASVWELEEESGRFIRGRYVSPPA